MDCGLECSYKVPHAVCADSGESDSSDWTEMSASSEVNEAYERETNITSHLTSAKRVLDDVSGRVAALKKSDAMISDRGMTSETCDADAAVSRYGLFVLVMLLC